MEHSYADLPRAWWIGCAGIVMGLIVLWVIAYSNPIQRVQLRYFPLGTPVPVSELRPGGPPYRGYPLSDVAAATSLDTLRRTVLGNAPCPYPPPTDEGRCWADVHAAASMLLVAAVPQGCGSREWYGWTHDSTLTIDLATWGCVSLGNRNDSAPEATYALLGVPLSRLPHGSLLVHVADSVGPPVPVTVP